MGRHLISRAFLRLAYGHTTWKILWALHHRCEAAGADPRHALDLALTHARRVECDLVGHLAVTRQAESVARLRRHWPRLPHETAQTLVRLAYERLHCEAMGR